MREREREKPPLQADHRPSTKVYTKKGRQNARRATGARERPRFITPTTPPRARVRAMRIPRGVTSVFPGGDGVRFGNARIGEDTSERSPSSRGFATKVGDPKPAAMGGGGGERKLRTLFELLPVPRSYERSTFLFERGLVSCSSGSPEECSMLHRSGSFFLSLSLFFYILLSRLQRVRYGVSRGSRVIKRE